MDPGRRACARRRFAIRSRYPAKAPGSTADTKPVSTPHPLVAGPVVMLDGETLFVPKELAVSLDHLVGFLESTAMDRGRILASVLVDGLPLEVLLANNATMGFQRVAAVTMSPADLGAQVVLSARDSVERLVREVDERIVMVLINDWPVVGRLWLDLTPGLRTPMLGLGFLKELWGLSLDELRVGEATFLDHWERLQGIIDDAERLLRGREDVIAFSQLLELRLKPWLERTLTFLDRLDDAKLS